jgi:hypothetical protein
MLKVFGECVESGSLDFCCCRSFSWNEGITINSYNIEDERIINFRTKINNKLLTIKDKVMIENRVEISNDKVMTLLEAYNIYLKFMKDVIVDEYIEHCIEQCNNSFCCCKSRNAIKNKEELKKEFEIDGKLKESKYEIKYIQKYIELLLKSDLVKRRITNHDVKTIISEGDKFSILPENKFTDSVYCAYKPYDTNNHIFIYNNEIYKYDYDQRNQLYKVTKDEEMKIKKIKKIKEDVLKIIEQQKKIKIDETRDVELNDMIIIILDETLKHTSGLLISHDIQRNYNKYNKKQFDELNLLMKYQNEHNVGREIAVMNIRTINWESWKIYFHSMLLRRDYDDFMIFKKGTIVIDKRNDKRNIAKAVCLVLIFVVFMLSLLSGMFIIFNK